MIDRILEVEPGRRALAVRNVPGTLTIFDSHFPRFPVLPGVLLLESMATTAGLIVEGPTTLAGAEVVRFRHFVRPGDQALIEALAVGGNVFKVEVRAGDRVVATARRLRLAPVRQPVGAPS